MSDRIVCLDGYTLNPGDLSWEPFTQLGPFTVHDRTPAEQIVPRAAEASYILTNKVPLDAASLAQLPQLRYIGVLATGYNIVDVPAARKQGITVTNVPAYSSDSVAQHTIALMLELTRRIGLHDRAVHEGQWAACPDFSFTLAPITELTGKTLGIVGLGSIGLAVARIAAAMGMNITAYSRNPQTARTAELDVTFLPLDELFATADVLSLHCPLTEDTHHMVNAARLSRMKASAFVINTGRGPLVDETALADALKQQQIAGAAVDVLSAEPPAVDHPLLATNVPNCIITPHIAWCAREARQRLMNIAAANLHAFQQNQPVNVVS